MRAGETFGVKGTVRAFAAVQLAKEAKKLTRQRTHWASELNDFKARYEVLSKTKSGLEVSKAALENQLEDLRDALNVGCYP